MWGFPEKNVEKNDDFCLQFPFKKTTRSNNYNLCCCIPEKEYKTVSK